MHDIPNSAIPASFDAAAECAAAITKPALGFRSAAYNHHAAVFVRFSTAQAAGARALGIIESISRAKDGTWLYSARCPYCRGTHRHGGGKAAQPKFGSRVADCQDGGEYALTAVAVTHG
ncbi:hypothetical protein KUF54_01455 [Comamonas sp. Y33R10-2]|uniref:hypothetical protein n=1 Tax=Comamonas sp. Y33R10-2 TaxID=2853257 RepID=UPI001C5CBA09|nr:hypothetical protein [Comamonas sp. Y33R10-2]QXZ09967.1 hypothetical protein KUF54_01455 [Comamonas sp. Y33R10-2]